MDKLPEKYRTDLMIIRETADQVVRDLNVKDFELRLSGNPQLAFNELVLQLTPVIVKLYKDDYLSFQALLYRIDINEKDYKKALAIVNPGLFGEKLSELIVRREFQKVITRRYFSEKK